MDNRLNIGSEVRELKLGSTFTNTTASNVFHTIKYDFKPASVDVNKPAELEVSANKQVTVTVPHLDGSGVPNTVFKGNLRDYSRKDCVLILNRATGEITLEQLNSSIVVKKTRIENKVNPPPLPPTIKVENNTARQSSKTKITTGLRKNAPINFVPKHSPLQGSPSYPHRSPQSAPAWNANNTQQTLPSIPMIGLDDGMDFSAGMPPTSSSTSSASSSSAASSMNNHLNNNSSGTNNSNHGGSNNHHHNQHHHQQHLLHSSSSSGSGNSNSSTAGPMNSSNNHSSNSYLNHGTVLNNTSASGSSSSSNNNHHHHHGGMNNSSSNSNHHHNNHLSVPSAYGSGGLGRNHLLSEPSMPPSVEVSLPPDRSLLPPPAVTRMGTGPNSDPEMMTSSESDGSDDSDTSSSDQESDSSTEDNDSPAKNVEPSFYPRLDVAITAAAAAVDLSKDLCLSSNSDSDD